MAKKLSSLQDLDFLRDELTMDQAERIEEMKQSMEKDQMAERILELEAQIENNKSRAVKLFDPNKTIFMTDGTLEGSQVFINGKIQQNLSSCMMFINARKGVSASIETMVLPDKGNPNFFECERHWIHGKPDKKDQVKEQQ